MSSQEQLDKILKEAQNLKIAINVLSYDVYRILRKVEKR